MLNPSQSNNNKHLFNLTTSTHTNLSEQEFTLEMLPKI